MRAPGSDRMIDEMEQARTDMLIGGVEHDNIISIAKQRFDHYTRLSIDIGLKNEAYRYLISQMAPYIELPSEEEEELTKEEQDKEFLKTWKSVDWNEVRKQLPTVAKED